MKLFVLGATGRTGTQLVDLALGRGHDVTAFVRTPGKLPARPRLREVVGVPRTGEGLAQALVGHDAVISVTGAYPRDALRRSTLMTDCGTALVRAMQTARVSRLAVLSAAVLFPVDGLLFAFARWFLSHHARDLTGMEAAVRDSGLGWTIARPPRLVDAHDTTYRAVVGAHPPGGVTVSFRGVAEFLLRAVERDEHVGQIVGIAR